MRSRILFATLLAVLLCAAPAVAQTPEPASLEAAYEFDGTLTPAFSETSPAAAVRGSSTFAEATVDGVTRQVGVFSAGQPYKYENGQLTNPDFAISMLFRLDAVSGRRRILALRGPSSQNALFVQDGKLVYDLGASDVAAGEERIAAGEWASLTFVRRSDDVVRVYVDGELALGFTDSTGAAEFLPHVDLDFGTSNERLRLFDGVDAEASSGQIARLRLFEDEMDAATAQGLSRLDQAAPVVTFPSETAIDGRYRMNASDQLFAEVVDGGSGAGLESWLELVPDIGAAVEVDGSRKTRALAKVGGHAPGPERVVTYNGFGPWPALEDGKRYDLVVKATDAAGNVSAEQRFPITADLTAPAGLTIDGPGPSTSDRKPLISGTVVAGAYDDTRVYGELCTGTTCDEIARGSSTDSQIAWFGADVVGGRWSAEVGREDLDSETSPPAMLDLPNGTYTAQVWFCDAVSNCISRSRTFAVTDPEHPAPVDDGKDEQPEPKPQPPAPPAPSAQAGTPQAVAPAPGLPAAQDVAGQLSRAAVTGLVRARLKGLLRGAALALRPARPGTVSVQVLDARKQRVLARGAGAGTLKVRPTAAGRAKLRRPRRVTVVVRTTFTPAGGPAVRVDRRVTLKR